MTGSKDSKDSKANASADESMIEIPEQFICPITQELMQDPVVTKYGQSYERSAILEWISQGKDCPLTRQPLTLGGIITNHPLRSKIRQWQVKNELDITLITHDPLERMGLYGYFMIPAKNFEDTERTTDSEEDDNAVIREVAPAQPQQSSAQQRTRPSSSSSRRGRRRFFLGRRRRGNNTNVIAAQS